MKRLIHQLEQYVRETLGITVVAQPWENAKRLPPYLRERYRFFGVEILGNDCLLMVDSGEEQTPAVVRKHLGQLRSRGGGEVVYVRRAVISYNRKRLIEQKVPFIVPGNQMYLPMLGIDLREHLKRSWEKKPVFSPSTQALILFALWQKTTERMTPSAMAYRLGYSAMTMSRVFDELEAVGIGEHSVMKKERHLHFAESGKTLWEKVLPYLNTPIRRRLVVTSPPQKGGGFWAGESALAHYTLLSEPRIPVLAFPIDQWKRRMQDEKIIELAYPEPESCEIELWKYSPAAFAQAGTVDRLSLYLSLSDNPDERVQSALEALLGGMEW